MNHDFQLFHICQLNIRCVSVCDASDNVVLLAGIGLLDDCLVCGIQIAMFHPSQLNPQFVRIVGLVIYVTTAVIKPLL